MAVSISQAVKKGDNLRSLSLSDPMSAHPNRKIETRGKHPPNKNTQNVAQLP